MCISPKSTPLEGLEQEVKLTDHLLWARQGAFHIATHRSLHDTLEGGCHAPHFPCEGTEAQRGVVAEGIRAEGADHDLHTGILTADVLRGQHCSPASGLPNDVCGGRKVLGTSHVPSSGLGWHGSTFSSFIRITFSTGNLEIWGCF